MNHIFPHNPSPPKNCLECGYLAECGGLDGEGFHKGCFQRCTTHCVLKGCDSVCPANALAFEEMLEDVGGFCVPVGRNLVLPNTGKFPAYIPQINHGGRRCELLDEAWVAVPLYRVIGKTRSGKYGVKFASEVNLRAFLRVSAETKLILVCSVPDRIIEEFWAEHVVRDMLPKIASLGFAGMTTPNYSFMLDVPRTNSLYNLSRIFRISERISDAGIPTIPHINASNKRDWKRWESLLKEQSDLNCVSMEFQTGLENTQLGNAFLVHLFEMQQLLGRELHPFVIGGAFRIKAFADHFTSFTITDAMPFIKTMHRQFLAPNGEWESAGTQLGESLDSYLAQNIELYRKAILAKAGIHWNGIPQQLKFGRAVA